MKIKINQNQKETEIPITIKDNWQRIEDIKSELRSCVASPAFCKVEVMQMWEDE